MLSINEAVSFLLFQKTESLFGVIWQLINRNILEESLKRKDSWLWKISVNRMLMWTTILRYSWKNCYRQSAKWLTGLNAFCYLLLLCFCNQPIVFSRTNFLASSASWTPSHELHLTFGENFLEVRWNVSSSFSHFFVKRCCFFRSAAS